MEALMIWMRQAKLLIRKDYIIAKRNLRSTLISMIVPFIFVAFLVVLQYALQNSQRDGDLIKPVREGELTVIPTIPRCRLGPDLDTCHTLAYTPTNDPDVEAIVSSIKTGSGIPNDEVLSFESGSDLDRYLLANPNSTQGAYHFFANRDGSGTLQGVRYVIQYNNTITQFRRKRFDPAQSVLVPMQKAADLHIMKHIVGSTLDVDFNYYTFAHPEIQPLDVVATFGPAFFFGALMFNFVIQLGRLVGEKELKLKGAMELMGLSDSVYWTTAFLNAAFFNTISVLTLIISGQIFRIDFFVKTDFGLYFFLFFLFGISMAPLALLLSVFVSRARTATVLGFGVFLVGSIVQGFSSLIYEADVAIIYRIVFSLLPFSLLSKGMLDLGGFTDTEEGQGLRWSARSTYTDFFPITDVYLWFLLDAFIFTVLAVYLDKVLPNENGVREPLFFFLRRSYWSSSSSADAAPAAAASALDEAEHSQLGAEDIDADVLAEIRGSLGDGAKTLPFRMLNLKKTFYGYKNFRHDPSKDFHAVRGLYLTIEPKTLFCLLGHNGAGKTTSINVLTGQMNPTEGDAIILGHSIRTQMKQIQKRMGVCPQYDVLWPQMTAREHLELFAGLKDVPSEKIAEEVQQRLKDVDLVSHMDNLAGNFSGGMKRRLSVAIALTGDPGIVYLDEPTTGMDPVSRRKVWDLIERIKHDRVTILTTHSMEEADVLGDRIGIMKAGRLVCLGSSLRLKNRFGKGYRITIRSSPETVADVEKFVNTELPNSSVTSRDDMSVRLSIPRHNLDDLPAFFAKLESEKPRLGVFDIQLNLATLEEVFLEVGGLGEHDDRHGEQQAPEAQADTEKGCLQKMKGWPWYKKLCAFFVVFVLLGVIIVPFTMSSSDEVPELEVFSTSATLTDLPSDRWSRIEPKGNTMCAFGDEFSFFVKRRGNGAKLLIEFEGGGECWDSSTCTSGFGSARFNSSVDGLLPSLRHDNYSGVFESASRNPFQDYTHVYVPHCTADYFWGNATRLYDAGLTIRHLGALNTKTTLDWMFREVPASVLQASGSVVVAGWGAGAFGAALWSAHVANNYPAAKLTLLLDSALDVDAANTDGGNGVHAVAASAMAEWRSTAYTAWSLRTSPAVPSWIGSVSALSDAAFSLDAVVTLVAAHYNSSLQGFNVARVNFAQDQTQKDLILSKVFSTPSGRVALATNALTTQTLAAAFCPILKLSETRLINGIATDDYRGFVAFGAEHGLLNRDLFYTAKGASASSTDVGFVDWLDTAVDDTSSAVQVGTTSCT